MATIVAIVMLIALFPAPGSTQDPGIAGTATTIDIAEMPEQSAARARIIQGIPGLSVDVRAGNELLATGLTYGEVHQLPSQPPDYGRLTVTAAGTSSVLLFVDDYTATGPWPDSLALHLGEDRSLTSSTVINGDWGLYGNNSGLYSFHHAGVEDQFTSNGSVVATPQWQALSAGPNQMAFVLGPDTITVNFDAAPRRTVHIHIVGDRDVGFDAIAYSIDSRPDPVRFDHPFAPTWSVTPRHPGPITVYDSWLANAGRPLDITYTALDGTVTARPLTDPLSSGAPLTLAVLDGDPRSESALVGLATRPNGSREWIKSADYDWRLHTRSIHVFLEEASLLLLDSDATIHLFPADVGSTSTPMPTGRTSITDVQRAADGSWVVTLASFSDSVASFDSDLPQLSIRKSPGSEGPGNRTGTRGDIHLLGGDMGQLVASVDGDGAGTSVTVWRNRSEFERASAPVDLCAQYEITVDLALGQQPTAGNDVIAGTSDNDIIEAGAGNDIICGRGGDDVIWGQAGNDRIDGGDGDDHIRGGDGNDILRGGTGRDDISGGRDDDQVFGGSGGDFAVRGGTGDDFVDGGSGNDPLVAGNGGSDVVIGGLHRDKVTGGPRPDWVYGAQGDDEVKGNKGADVIDGGPDHDQLFGGPQPDQISGGAGIDFCNGGTQVDAIDADCESIINP